MGDDLAEVASLAARGIYDPVNHFLPRTPVGGWSDLPPSAAERAFLRYYWAAVADWQPDRWNLIFAARVHDQIVGVQEIGAQSFRLTRTVSTGSWVALEHQRAGHGKSMREAVLWFAFAVLGSERADSAAWSSNEASLKVSRALGYQPNGTTIRAADGRRVEQVNLTISRSDWTEPPGRFTAAGLTTGIRTLLGCLNIDT
jgi:RimJ/RimL family protein N-acetyltransferase